LGRPPHQGIADVGRVQQSPPQATFHELPAIEDPDYCENTRAETAITVVAAAVTVTIVSFVAVLMAMA
jgi:hypothetical protein